MHLDPAKPAIVAVFLFSLAIALLASARLKAPDRVAWESVRPGRVESDYAKLPLLFVENRGQRDTDAAYYVEGRSVTIDFHAAGVTYELDSPALPATSMAPAAGPGRARLDLKFVGATPVEPVAQARQAATVSYFGTADTGEYRGLATYAELRYTGLWPGIDLAYSGTIDRVKYHFRVAPGADPATIRLAWSGATDIRVNAAGEMDVVTPVTTLTDERPVAWQDIDGERIPVDVAFALGERTGDGQTYGFKLGSYDPAHELVLDPAVFVYSGYLSDTGWGRAIATDAQGNAYVAGYELNRGVYVIKVNTTGTSFAYVAQFPRIESVEGIAVDASGSTYVVGSTNAYNLPATVGPDLDYNGGPTDAYVLKLDPSGANLEYAGYIGGDAYEYATGIAIDPSGNAYVVGRTDSTEDTFPAHGGPDLTYGGGGSGFGGDGFVAKVNAAGTAFAYAGYVGGAGLDSVNDVAVDDAGNAYLAGATQSSQATFPIVGALDPTRNGLEDAFVMKLDPAGGIAWSGYIGGDCGESGYGIAVDPGGNAYVVGITCSDQSSFPVTIGPDLTASLSDNAFIVKVDAGGQKVIYGGYISGDDFEDAHAVAVDSAGYAYVGGRTSSNELTFPVAGGPDLTHNGVTDGFVAKVSADGTAIEFAGYVGGVSFDEIEDLAIDARGNVYVTGITQSDESSFPLIAGPILTYPGTDVHGASFVAKIAASNWARLETVDDLNGDRDPEVVVMEHLPGEQRLIVDVRGARSTSLVQSFEFDQGDAPIATTVFPDSNLNGAPELAVLRQTEVGGDLTEIRDLLTGAPIVTMTTGPVFAPQAIVALRTAAGVPAVAILGRRADGVLRVPVLRATGAYESTVWFGNDSDFAPKDLAVLADLDGNQAPELALLSQSKRPGKPDRVQIRDSLTGSVLRNVWFGMGSEPRQLVVVPDADGDGSEELAVLRDGDPTVIVRNALTGAKVASVAFSQDEYEPRELGVIADGTGDGNPELVMFAFRPSDDKVRAQVKEVGSPAGQAVIKAYFGSAVTPEAFGIVPDANANQGPDLVRLGYATADGTLRFAVRDGVTGAVIGPSSP